MLQVQHDTTTYHRYSLVMYKGQRHLLERQVVPSGDGLVLDDKLPHPRAVIPPLEPGEHVQAIVRVLHKRRVQATPTGRGTGERAALIIKTRIPKADATLKMDAPGQKTSTFVRATLCPSERGRQLWLKLTRHEAKYRPSRVILVVVVVQHIVSILAPLL